MLVSGKSDARLRVASQLISKCKYQGLSTKDDRDVDERGNKERIDRIDRV